MGAAAVPLVVPPVHDTRLLKEQWPTLVILSRRGAGADIQRIKVTSRAEMALQHEGEALGTANKTEFFII